VGSVQENQEDQGSEHAEDGDHERGGRIVMGVGGGAVGWGALLRATPEVAVVSVEPAAV
jgi:hypothetical protein